MAGLREVEGSKELLRTVCMITKQIQTCPHQLESRKARGRRDTESKRWCEESVRAGGSWMAAAGQSALSGSARRYWPSFHVAAHRHPLYLGPIVGTVRRTG